MEAPSQRRTPRNATRTGERKQETRMPTTKSAAKRMRTSEQARQRNMAAKSQLRSQRRKVSEAIAAGNKPEAQKGFARLVSLYDKAVKKRLLKLNTVSRYKSRIASKINALPA
jgi:small subunit ribosomal protein S20